jgi:hypothetical protein
LANFAVDNYDGLLGEESGISMKVKNPTFAHPEDRAGTNMGHPANASRLRQTTRMVNTEVDRGGNFLARVFVLRFMKDSERTLHERR